MTPIDQTVFGFDEGNCFAACIASILEIPLDSIPFFFDVDDWWSKFDSWLEAKGLDCMYYLFGPNENTLKELSSSDTYILSGLSPRATDGQLHAVVAGQGKILHDPHPTRHGLMDFYDAILITPRHKSRA